MIRRSPGRLAGSEEKGDEEVMYLFHYTYSTCDSPG